MEFEIYESELADYSLQDSPFYEANTPIIFGLTTSSQTSAYGSNHHRHHHHHSTASKVDGLNLMSKKSSMKMMSTKCQQQQSLKSLAFERSPTNGIGSTKTIDAGNSIISKKSRSETMTDRLYAEKRVDVDRNGCNSDNVQPKKKRKCVSFLPNFVQVRVFLLLILLENLPLNLRKK